MDALSELLRVIRLDSAFYINAELSAPWCLRSPEAHTLAPLLTKGAGHVIIYHLLIEGTAYAQLIDGEPVALQAGDLVSLPHGHSHLLGNGSGAQAMHVERTLPEFLAKGLELVSAGGGGTPSRFICGYLACDPQLCQAFLGGLPPIVKVNLRDDDSGRWLENSLRFSVAQAAGRDAAMDATLTKLSEVLFGETLRRYARDLPLEETGWFAASRDPNVGQALTLIHHRPAHPWTLAELAREAGVSRTVLAERFNHFLGEPPIVYLTRWRLRLGARELLASNHSVARIALEVGYESEASFNRAFKREYGLPPARYRKEKSERRTVEVDA